MRTHANPLTARLLPRLRSLPPLPPVSAARAAELGLALVLLAAAVPFLVAAAVLIKLTSRGPVVYSQVRLGLHGRPYRIFKLRTMAHDCERLSGPCWSQPGDPRVTRVGAWLRRTHVDELPQLVNVLRGDMALVGPRPERPELARPLEAQLPRYRERLRVRPGVTGLAQVQLPPDTDVESVRRKLALDLCYVERRGAWLDLRILAGTALKLTGVPFTTIRAALRLPGAGARRSRPPRSRSWRPSDPTIRPQSIDPRTWRPLS